MTVLFDTLSGRKIDPVRPGSSTVGIYLCGVTVYDDVHIGHARTIVVFDVLRNHLERTGGLSVRMVQNFTDVDDKIIARARAEDTTAAAISGRYINRYHDELNRLGVQRADVYPRATEHIGDMIHFIEDLVRKGVAYRSENGVYFAVSKFPRYGALSKKRTDDLQLGARVEVDETKENPLDFALWKFASDEPTWDSPWGAGRPGWHIECSAMSTRYLGGDTIDVHGGGRDLIFPHHENEIAQSESRMDGEFARIWMHVGMVTIQGEKMSKSLGNIRTLNKVLHDWGANVIRLFCLSGHYSKPIDYSEENLSESLARWRQIEACSCELAHAARKGALGDDAYDKAVAATDNDDNDNDNDNDVSDTGAEFDWALDHDLNTHLALVALMRLVSDTNNKIAGGTLNAGWASRAGAELSRMTGVLGLTIPEMTEEYCMSIDAIVAERNTLRMNREYKRADEIRDRLAAQNIEILDRGGGETVWIRREPVCGDAGS